MVNERRCSKRLVRGCKEIGKFVHVRENARSPGLGYRLIVKVKGKRKRNQGTTSWISFGFRKSKQSGERGVGGSVLVRVSIIDIPLEAAETQVFLLSSLYIVLSALYQSIIRARRKTRGIARISLYPGHHGRRVSDVRPLTLTSRFIILPNFTVCVERSRCSFLRQSARTFNDRRTRRVFPNEERTQH